MALADPCTVLQRLFNPDPATQELAYDGSTITWLRGGSSPEAWRVTFAHTADGVNWSSLGEPVRIAGGWELTGAALPDQGTIRARAYVRNGAGSGFVETLLTLGEAPEIRILAEDAGFGPDGFQFTVAGPVGATLVVEVSDNLTDWTEQGTLQLDGEADTFRDAEAAASGARFYRVRLAP